MSDSDNVGLWFTSMSNNSALVVHTPYDRFSFDKALLPQVQKSTRETTYCPSDLVPYIEPDGTPCWMVRIALAGGHLTVGTVDALSEALAKFSEARSSLISELDTLAFLERNLKSRCTQAS